MAWGEHPAIRKLELGVSDVGFVGFHVGLGDDEFRLAAFDHALGGVGAGLGGFDVGLGGIKRSAAGIEAALGGVHVRLGHGAGVLAGKAFVASVVDPGDLVIRPRFRCLRAGLGDLGLRLFVIGARLGDGRLRLEHLRFGLVEIGKGALKRHVVRARVQFDQQVTGFDGLIIIDPDFQGQTGHARADLMHMRRGVGVIGRNMGLFVVVECQPRDDEHSQHDQRQDDSQRGKKELLYLAFLFILVAVFAVFFIAVATSTLLVIATFSALLIFPLATFFFLVVVFVLLVSLLIAFLAGFFVALFKGGGDPFEDRPQLILRSGRRVIRRSLVGGVHGHNRIVNNPSPGFKSGNVFIRIELSNRRRRYFPTLNIHPLPPCLPPLLLPRQTPPVMC